MSFLPNNATKRSLTMTIAFRETPLQPQHLTCKQLEHSLRADQHVQAVLKTIAAMNLTSLHNAYRRTGSKLYPPERMLAIALVEMSTEAGKHSSRLRGQVIERRFADGKQHRGQGHQNGRGLLRVSAEVGLLVIAQNLLTLYNLEKRTQNNPP